MHNSEELAQHRALMEAFSLLSTDNKMANADDFINCKDFLMELTYILTNPVISSSIKERYYHENGGKILRGMVNFFDFILNDTALQDYLRDSFAEIFLNKS